MSDTDPGSVTLFFDGLRKGESEAIEKTYARFFADVARRAEAKLGRHRKVVDGEDIAQEAFTAFFRQVQGDGFERLNDRRDLAQILAFLVNRRASDVVRKLTADKRGGGAVAGESVFLRGEDSSGKSPGLDGFAGPPPVEQMAEEVVGQLNQVWGELPTDEHRRVAALRLEGHEIEQIAKILGCSTSTVDRRLKDIRRLWQMEED